MINWSCQLMNNHNLELRKCILNIIHWIFYLLYCLCCSADLCIFFSFQNTIFLEQYGKTKTIHFSRRNLFIKKTKQDLKLFKYWCAHAGTLLCTSGNQGNISFVILPAGLHAIFIRSVLPIEWVSKQSAIGLGWSSNYVHWCLKR